jgi:hypothetical protein
MSVPPLHETVVAKAPAASRETIETRRILMGPPRGGSR